MVNKTIIIGRRKLTVLFVIFIAWLVIALFGVYQANFGISKQLSREKAETEMAKYIAIEIAKISEEWRGLAYQLNPEAAKKMDKMINDYYQGKGKQQKRSKPKEFKI